MSLTSSEDTLFRMCGSLNFIIRKRGLNDTRNKKFCVLKNQNDSNQNARTLRLPKPGVQAGSTYGSALSWLQVTSEEPGVTPHWPSRPGPASAELQQVTTTQQLPPDLGESDMMTHGEQ